MVLTVLLDQGGRTRGRVVREEVEVLPFRLRHPGGVQLLDPVAVRVQHAERTVAGPGEGGGGVHDLLEGGAQLQVAADVEDRLQEHRQPPGGGRARLHGPLHPRRPRRPSHRPVRADALTPPAG
ncbi:hypothetical protein RB201_11385 [Streptomyces sp. S1A(2023)]